MGQFDGRVALVTGGGRGAGKGISELLAEHGATIAVNYRKDEAAASETVRGIVERGGTAMAFQASADDPAQCERLANEVIEAFGGVDILVCNAGIASRGRTVVDTDIDEVTRLMSINCFGPHQLCKHVLPSMRTRGRGDIVFISSITTDHFAANSAPYSMSKAAMEGLSCVLAKEERQYGIHVNTVAPGIIETDMGVRLARAMTGNREITDLRILDAVSPFGRPCQPKDVAEVVVWLCSQGAGYVTGQRIVCDGGGR
jgi:3-oxoacyl-[acyl-carrier protein] reductase